MPRRTTKTTKAVKMKEEESSKALEEIPLYLRDFRNIVEQILKNCEEQSNSLIKSITSRYKINLSKLSTEEKNMKYESFFDQKAVDERDSVLEQNPDVDQLITSIKSTRKRKLQSAKKSALSVRRSTRRKVDETPINKAGMITPIQTAGAIGRTPFITPKFNPMTPMNRTVHRQARPNEVLVSLDGSPVMATVTKGRGKKKTEVEEFAQIPLGGAYTLNLPINTDIEHSGLELDADQIQKLAILNEGITNILKGRVVSTDSE